MKPTLGAAIGMAKNHLLRSLATVARSSPAASRLAEALLASRLERREERLFSALGGAMSFHLLRTAYDVGLFALLHRAPGLRAREIAERLGLGAYPTEILLLGLVPMGLVVKTGDRYFCDPILSGELAGEGLGKLVRYFHEIVNPAVAHLEASVRRGEPIGLHRLFGEDAGGFYEALGASAAHGACFREAMAEDTRYNRDRVAASHVFAGRRRVLDVGGNVGELAIAIAAQHPEARVTVLDFPPVAAEAWERFRALGLLDRLDVVGADLTRDALPPGHDVVLFAHLLDIFSPAAVRALLKRAFAALPEGGTVCVFGSAMRDAETGPLVYGVLSAYFLCLAGGRGRFYTAAQTVRAMRAAGFSDIERTALPRHEVLLVGRKRAPAGSHLGTKLAALVRLGRPRFLVYSLLLYALGTAAAAREGRALDLAPWIHGLAFVWCAHLMTHLCNERFDLRADAENAAPTRWTGGSRVLVEGHLRPAVALAGAVALLVGALALALTMPGDAARWTAVGIVALGWFYTAPPLSLAHRGLGEVTVAAVLDLLVPLLAYTLVPGRASAPGVLLAACLPLFVAQAARMLVMNLCDRKGDRRAGKRTLAVRLGPRRARRAAVLAEVFAYSALVVLTATRALPLAPGLAMTATAPLAAWLAWKLLRGAPRGRADAERMALWASTHAAVLAAAAMLGLIASAPSGVDRLAVAICAGVLAIYVTALAVSIVQRGR